jgi:hypothetical protein
VTIAIHEDDMPTPVEPFQPPQRQVASVSPFQGADALNQWINNARQLAPVADYLSRTSFVPAAMRGKPAEVAAAWLAGQELGFGPMASLRMIDVIEGKPSLPAIALRALVQAHGHDIWVEESTASRAIVMGRRKGSDRVFKSVWDMDRATRLELHTKANWKKQPTNMLLARATSECARLVAADVIAGMPYSSEELRDGYFGEDEETPQSTVVSMPTKRTAKRKPLERMESAEPEPEQKAPPVVEEPVDPNTPASPDQLAEVRRLSAVAEMDVEALMRFATDKVGRFVTAPKDLTVADADMVVEALERFIAQQEPAVAA